MFFEILYLIILLAIFGFFDKPKTNYDPQYKDNKFY